MARAPRNDEAANHTIAIRATQGEKEALDRVLTRAAPELPPGTSRSDLFRRLILDLDAGVVVPLTDDDRAALARLVEGRAAELARMGVHEARVTPASMLVHLLRSAGAPAVASTAPPVVVPLPAQPSLPFGPAAPLAPSSPVVPAEPAPSPVEPVHEAALAPVVPSAAPEHVHEAPPVAAPVEPVAVHEAGALAELEHEAALATVRAAAKKAIDGGRTQADLRRDAKRVADVDIDAGIISRFVKGGPMAAAKLAALAKALGL